MKTEHEDLYKELRESTNGLAVHASDWTTAAAGAIRRRAKRDGFKVETTDHGNRIISLGLVSIPDVRVVQHAPGMYQFFCDTARAKTWVTEHVAEPIWLDGKRSFPVDDGGYARDIRDGMLAAGLQVAA